MVTTITVYWPATRCGFVNFDDDLYVTSNLHVQNGLSLENIKWAFLNPVASNWHPLTVLSHMLDCQIFGLNPRGHHLTSILLQALNAALVFGLLQLMTGAMWRSLLVAALFAVHPLHVESVVWVSERKDLLSGFWGLLSLVFYVSYAQKRMTLENRKQELYGNSLPADRSQTLDYLLALIFLAFGLMSKAMLVTWPFVLLLLDYWPLERFQPSRLRSLAMEKVPLFALAAMAGVMTLLVQQHAGAMAPVESLPMGERCENSLISYCRYLGKLFLPENLSVFYPHPGFWPLGQVFMAGLLIIALSVLFLLQKRHYPFSLMGWLWFIGTLVPVIGLVQVGDQSLADRYVYLPSLGVLIMVIWGADEVTQGWRHRVVVLSGAGLAAIVLCITLTRQQIGYWQDSEILFQHALAVTKNNHIAHNNYGAVLEEKGQLDDAISQFEEAIRLRSDDAPAHYNLGNAFARKNLFDEAINQYQEVIRLEPDDVPNHINLGNVFYQKGQLDKAVNQYREALRLEPDNATAHYNLGKILDKMGQTEEAIHQCQEAIRLKPDYAEAHNNLGYILQSAGRVDEAIHQYQEAIRLRPDYALARNNLAKASETKSALTGH